MPLPRVLCVPCAEHAYGIGEPKPVYSVPLLSHIPPGMLRLASTQSLGRAPATACRYRIYLSASGISFSLCNLSLLDNTLIRKCVAYILLIESIKSELPLHFHALAILRVD